MARWHLALADDGDLASFQDAARRLTAIDASPDDVTFGGPEEGVLFGQSPPPADAPLGVPRAFVSLASLVVAHADPLRFALLYRLLWRLLHGERHLLQVSADPLVHRLEMMARAVRRDMHKMTAFVRFRRVIVDGGPDDGRGDGPGGGHEHYVAWFEPEHLILRRMQDFFCDRFASMRWSILTPRGCMHWDKATIRFTPGVTRSEAPPADGLEAWWQAYYRAMFNPARINPEAMRAEMPRKYWHNLPEAALIPELLQQAPARTEAMLEAAPVTARKSIPAPRHTPAPEGDTLAALRHASTSCARCSLHAPATQTVFGEGPPDAPVIFIGEQPGDQEDLAGRPFVGPAGQLFDRALAEAGLDRRLIYVTNAVKHFKFVLRGKRRIHQKPDAGEIEACHWWLAEELRLIRPRLAVAMGATAARALTGRAVTIGRERGRITSMAHFHGLITVHPSFLLRLPDKAAQKAEYRRFVEDLAIVGNEVSDVRLVA
ncbi:DNA polymerase [Arboricoccus pini]|uniref:Type-4 uracil-DNA glycosylase n=1 Tax=Arboricoccus pini TaxID=1963835 RepID=A0A212RDE8_9PROT|nr:UdgX family uracil-DNA binding protein [Arboricoccus pini]SNB70275.1 DNA polymerase [Arboricoccus pini]